MAQYETTARPILTETELAAAKAAGACVEFTIMPRDGYDLPPYDEPGSGGWVKSSRPSESLLADGRLRAFYPVAEPPFRQPFELGQRVRWADGVELTGTIVGIRDRADDNEPLLVELDEQFAKYGVTEHASFPIDRGCNASSTGERTLVWAPASVEIIDAETPDTRIVADWTAPSVSEGSHVPDDAPVADPSEPYAFDVDDATIGAETPVDYDEPKLSPGPAPRFRINVAIEADSQEGYMAALVTLANGWAGWDA